MSTSNPIIEALRERWDDCRKKAQLLKTELDELTTTMDAYQLVIADFDQNHVGASGGKGSHAHISPSQLADCKTQRQAWEQIARLSGGYARPSEGGQLIVDVELTKMNRRGAIASATNMMSNSDDWDRVGVGLYSLLSYMDSTVPDAAGEGGDQLPDYLSPIDGDDVAFALRPDDLTELMHEDALFKQAG